MGIVSDRNLIVSADFGTASVKVGLVGPQLAIEAVRTVSYPLNMADHGFAEQQPADWWKALRQAVWSLREDVPDLAVRTAGVVLAAQMCGVVCSDGDGEPLRPCLIWLDKRSSDIIRELVGGFPALFGYNIPRFALWLILSNGAPSLNGMDPPGKMLWVKRNEPEIWARTRKLLDVKDWLVHRATGVFATTPDCANLTWMMDSRWRRAEWSRYLARFVGVDMRLLPDIIPGTSAVAGLSRQAADELGLAAGLPVFAGCGDVCAAALGSGAIEDGSLHISIGTSSWIGGFFPTRRLSLSEAYATIVSPVDNRPLLIATQESAGACFRWIHDALSDVSPNLDDFLNGALKAGAVSPPLFLPWLAGERVPADDHRLRGAFLGLSLSHDRHSLIRAVLEGVALNTRWAFRTVIRQSGVRHDLPVPLVGEGATNPSFCQMLADCLDRELTAGMRPQLAGVRGAACLAAAGLGWAASPWLAARLPDNQNKRTYKPDPIRAQYFRRRFDLYLRAYRRTAPWFRHAFATMQRGAAE